MDYRSCWKTSASWRGIGFTANTGNLMIRIILLIIIHIEEL
jgi:hypothetical protein